MIEEFVHTADGELRAVDPFAHYLVVGNKVRCIDAKKAERISAYLREGAVGVITPEAVSRNLKKRTANGMIQIDAQWKVEDSTKPDRFYGQPTVMWWVPLDAVEPVYD